MAKTQKLGATALSGYFRQGLAELRAAAPYADSPIAQPTNYGMPGMATPGEVTEARRDDVSREESGLDSQINQVGPPRDDRGRDDQNRDDRGMDRD
jgi:hypothetical protein